ncbi:hypothetical protein [Candidatus Burkholderia verschuerenii]|nr:hypothetical protein [Candidatus Burkholderia verschuerenii]
MGAGARGCAVCIGIGGVLRSMRGGLFGCGGPPCATCGDALPANA